MANSFLVELGLVAPRVRLAVKEHLVRRLERIASLYERSQATDTKAPMPLIHTHALESLKVSIDRDKALIRELKGETPAPPGEPENPVTSPAESNQPYSQPVKRSSEKDKRKSRRKSYMK